MAYFQIYAGLQHVSLKAIWVRERKLEILNNIVCTYLDRHAKMTKFSCILQEQWLISTYSWLVT